MLLFLLNKKRWIFAEDKTATAVQELAIETSTVDSKAAVASDVIPKVSSQPGSTSSVVPAAMVPSPLQKVLPVASAQQPPA